MGSLQWILTVLASCMIASGQQIYETLQDCSNPNPPNVVYGYTCNGQQQNCQAYAIYRAQNGYQTLADISGLLNSDISQMAQINKQSDTQVLGIDQAIIAPINCSCAGNYSQANATYVVKSNDTYSTIANNTYEGLSTCQAMAQQNSVHSSDLQAGMSLTVPLRCACPTTMQVGQGILYLLSHLVRQGDSVYTIANQYGVTQQQLMDANDLGPNNDTIFVFTSLLVPLQKPPTNPPPQSPPQPPPPTSLTNTGGSNSGLHIGLSVGIAVAAALVVAAAAAACCIFFRRRKRIADTGESNSETTKANKATAMPTPVPDFLALALGLQDIGQTLPQYELQELEAATGNFSAANRIAGSVYRGIIGETSVAIKKMQGDVSQQVGILEKLNHFNLVRLWGLCVSDTRSYLVFEHAENGSLADYLKGNSPVLSWRQRLQIALDVADGLSYLHNYTVPPYVHKDIKSSNVLLDGNLRAKIANFGLAKSAEQGFAVTSHVMGTQGYMAPEYLAHGLVTPKLDVFSFGVILLELLSGKPPVLLGDGDVMLWTTIGEMVEGSNPKEKLKGFMDPKLKDDYPLEMAFAMAGLARTCVHEDLNSRFGITEVQMELSTWLIFFDDNQGPRSILKAPIKGQDPS